jgi:cytochrome c peroxidase
MWRLILHAAGVAAVGSLAILHAHVVDDETRPVVPLGLDLYRPVPEDNPLTPARIALGRRLFRDRRLSHDGSLACVDCHDPRRAFTSTRRGASQIGDAVVSRDVPTLVNRAWGSRFFWDGRAATLEEQALQPILNRDEMGMTKAGVLAVVRLPFYRMQFVEAFGAEPSVEHLGRALAAYVRTIVSGNSAYDREISGRGSPLSDLARRGLRLFTGRAGCTGCHLGPNLTDEQFHNTGVASRSGSSLDSGRALVTGLPEDKGAFKTPTLRQVAVTPPYMHDGSFPTLASVIDHYDRGGHPNPFLDSSLRPLRLSSVERRDIEAFLRSLTGEVSEGR